MTQSVLELADHQENVLVKLPSFLVLLPLLSLREGFSWTNFLNISIVSLKSGECLAASSKWVRAAGFRSRILRVLSLNP